MGAYDTIAESFKEARVSLKEKRIQQVAPPPPPPPPAPAPRAPVVPQRPAPAIPPLIAAPSVESDPAQELLTALSDLQERGQRYGVDTTQFDPRPGSTPFEFADEVHSVFDQIDSKVMADLQARQEYETDQASAFRNKFDAAVAPPSPIQNPSNGVLPGVAVPSETPDWFNPDATRGMWAANSMLTLPPKGRGYLDDEGNDIGLEPWRAAIRPVLNANTFEEFGRGLGDKYPLPISDNLSAAAQSNPLIKNILKPSLIGDIAGPVLRGAAHTTSPLEIAFTIATAGYGSVVTQAIRRMGIPVISKIAGVAAPMLEKGNFAQRLGVEWAAGGVAPEVGASAAMGAFEDAPAPVQIGAGLAGGVLAAGTTLVAPRLGIKGLKASKDLVTEGIQTALRLGEDSATAVGKANTGNVLLPASPDPVVAARSGSRDPNVLIDNMLEPMPRVVNGEFTPRGLDFDTGLPKDLETVPARIFGDFAIVKTPAGEFKVSHIPSGQAIGQPHRLLKDAKKQVQYSISMSDPEVLKISDPDQFPSEATWRLRMAWDRSMGRDVTHDTYVLGFKDPVAESILPEGGILGDDFGKAPEGTTITIDGVETRLGPDGKPIVETTARTIDPREVEADRIIAEADAEKAHADLVKDDPAVMEAAANYRIARDYSETALKDPKTTPEDNAVWRDHELEAYQALRAAEAAAVAPGTTPKFAFEGEPDLVLQHGTDAEFTGIPNAGKDGRIYFSDSTIEGRGASSFYGDTVKKFNLSDDARMMDRDEVLTKKQVKNIIAGAEDEIRRLGLPESEIARYKELITLTVDKKGRATAGEISDRLDSVDRSINPKMGEPGYDFRGGQSKSNIANAGLSREFDFIAPSGNRPHEYSVLNKDVIIDSGLRQDNLEPVGIRKGPDPDFNQFGEPYPTTPATGTAAARGAGIPTIDEIAADLRNQIADPLSPQSEKGLMLFPEDSLRIRAAALNPEANAQDLVKFNDEFGIDPVSFEIPEGHMWNNGRIQRYNYPPGVRPGFKEDVAPDFTTRLRSELDLPPVKQAGGAVTTGNLTLDGNRAEFETRFAALSKLTDDAEKTPNRQMTEEEVALWDNGNNWEEFSRSRGYTEAEIQDHQAFLDAYTEGRQLGYSDDELFDITRATQKDGELPVADDLPTSGQAAFDEAGEVGVRDVGPREDDIINDDSRRVQGGFFGEEDLKTSEQAAEMLEGTPFEKVYDDTPVSQAEQEVDGIIKELEIVQSRGMADEIVQGRVDRHDAPKGFSMRGISDDAIIKWMEANRPELNPYETGVLHNIDFEPDEYSALRQMNRTNPKGKSKAADKRAARELAKDLDEARYRLEEAESAEYYAKLAANDPDTDNFGKVDNLWDQPTVATKSGYNIHEDLKKSKPRYGYQQKHPPLDFQDDFDLLLYTATRKTRMGNRADKFGLEMDAEFGPEWRQASGLIRQAGRDLEARIKEQVKNAPDDGETIVVEVDGAYDRLKAATGQTSEGRPARTANSSTPASGLEDARYTVDKETGEIIDIMRGPLTAEEVSQLPEFLLARLRALGISSQNPRPAASQMSAGGQGVVPDSGVRPVQGTGDPVVMGPPLDVPGSGGGVQQATQGGVRPPLKTHPTEYVADVNTVKSVEAANAALKGEIIDSAVKGSPEDMGASAQLETGKLADFLRYIVPKDHAVDEKFLTAVQVGENLRNVSALLARSLDPGRLWDTIQKGRHGGVISEFIGWPTRRILRAKLEMSDKMKSDFAALMTKHRVTKPKHMEAVGDVIEYIGTKDIEGKVSTEDLLSRKVIFKLLKEFPSDERRRIVELALETRNFYDKVLYAINYARIKRGDKPIPKLDNYRPWIIAQRAWKERIKDGWKSKGAGGYEGMTPKMAEEVFGRRSYPTFMAPQSVMNDRAMQRTYGLKDVGKERDIAKLTYSYIDSALDDIYNNTIIANVTRHTKVLRENDLIKSADALDTWAQETYAGVPTPFTRFMRDSLPYVPVDHLMWVRRQLTRAVFPLNWSWNIAVQTSSVGLTYTRYGGMNTMKALNIAYDTTTNDWIKKHAYSAIMKKRNGGKVVYQDLGNALEKHATLEKSKFEKFEDIGNFLSSTIEERLTAHGIAAAKLKGEQLGLTGRSLIEFASEGGARTQSMYNREDTVGWLRSPEIGIIAPFQTFAFEMLNTLRELNIPILRGVEIPGIVPYLGNKNIGIGQAGAYETLSAKRITLGKQGTKDGKPVYGLSDATAEHRVKNVLRLVAAMYVTNLVQDKLMDRKPWNLGSFIPMYNLIVAGAAGSGPMNQPLYQKYSGDFFDAVGEYVEIGRWQPMRDFGLRYYTFGGGQIARTWGGIEAVAEGGVRNRSGMKKFELTPADQLAAYTGGVYATQPGKDYLDARVDRTAVEEFVGFDLPVIGGYSNGIKKEYREKFEEYYDIDKDIKGSKGRIAWRNKNWEVDANMFTVGIVRSIQSPRARTLAQELFEKHEIIDSETDPEDLEVYRRHLGTSFVRKMLEGLEHTPGLEKLPPLKKLPDSSSNEGSSVPGLEKLSSSPTDQWNKVSNVLNIKDLVALKKIWSNETISRQETESLKIAFEKEPMGQTNFRKWSRQTLRQIQTNAANVRTQPEFANV